MGKPLGRGRAPGSMLVRDDKGVRAAKTTVWITNREAVIAGSIAERSGISVAAVVRALILLHRDDTLLVEQHVEISVGVKKRGRKARKGRK